MKKLLFALSFGLLGQAYAQPRADSLPPNASLQQCIAYALANQPGIAQASLDEEIAEANIRSRLAEWYPQIGGNYSFQHNFQRSTTVFNGTPTPVGVTNTSTAQVYLSQALFNRDVLLAYRSQGDVRLQYRQLTEATRIDVTADVSKAFYDVLTTRRQIEVATENILRLQKSLNDAYYRYQSGVTDKTDYKRAQIALNNTLASRHANESALTAKIEMLKTLMGYPPEYGLSLSYDSLQMERDVAFDTLQVPDYSRRIEYQLLQTQKRLQEANLLYQRQSFLPTVSANAAYNFNYLNNHIGKLYGQNYPNSFIGLTAGIPIFQGGKRKALVHASELSLTRIGLDLVNLRNTVNSQYAAALAAYKGSFANYQASKANVELAREVYEVIQLQYGAGIKTYLEVISAETDLRTAQINYFNALYEVLASKVDAARALGAIRYQP